MFCWTSIISQIDLAQSNELQGNIGANERWIRDGLEADPKGCNVASNWSRIYYWESQFCYVLLVPNSKQHAVLGIRTSMFVLSQRNTIDYVAMDQKRTTPTKTVKLLND